MRVPGWDHRLPAVPKPFHLETIDSYIERLARANSIDPAALDDAARRDPATGIARGKSDGWKPLNVTRWTGLPVEYFRLNASMAYGGGGALRRSEGRYACSHCTHGEPVVQHPHHLYNACIKHHRWLRDGYNAQRTVDTATVRAEIRYQRVIRHAIRHQPLAYRIIGSIQDDLLRRLRRAGYGADKWQRLPVPENGPWAAPWQVEEENGVREAIAQYPMLVDLVAIAVSWPVFDILTSCPVPRDLRGNNTFRERRILDHLYGHPVRVRLGHGDWLVLNEMPGILRAAADEWSLVPWTESRNASYTLPTPTWPGPRTRRTQQWHLAPLDDVDVA